MDISNKDELGGVMKVAKVKVGSKLAKNMEFSPEKRSKIDIEPENRREIFLNKNHL